MQIATVWRLELNKNGSLVKRWSLQTKIATPPESLHLENPTRDKMKIESG